MSDEHQCKNSTPKDVLLRQLMDCNVAKNEREWMASEEIANLTVKNESLTALAKLGQWVLNTREEGGEGMDFGSKAIELGLLAEVMATEPCGEKCLCDTWALFPQKCLRLTDKAKVLGHD